MTLRIDLPPEKEAALEAQARAAGLSPEDFARQALNKALVAGEQGNKPLDDERPVFELIQEIWADMPEDVRSKLPRDGASVRFPKRG